MWMKQNTRFGETGVKIFEIDCASVAAAYKRYLHAEKQREKNKTRLTDAFVAWRVSTAYFQEKEVRQMGRICANIAAARARGSKEPEWFLALI